MDAGVNAGVAIAPVIPGITDDAHGLESVARAAAAYGARFLWANALCLKPGTKEHFMDFVGREYPQLSPDLGRLYPGAFAPGVVQQQLSRRVGELRSSYGLANRPTRSPGEAQRPRQLELALS